MPVLRLKSNLAHYTLSEVLLIVTPSIVGNLSEAKAFPF